MFSFSFWFWSSAKYFSTWQKSRLAGPYVSFAARPRINFHFLRWLLNCCVAAKKEGAGAKMRLVSSFFAFFRRSLYNLRLLIQPRSPSTYSFLIYHRCVIFDKRVKNHSLFHVESTVKEKIESPSQLRGATLERAWVRLRLVSWGIAGTSRGLLGSRETPQSNVP